MTDRVAELVRMLAEVEDELLQLTGGEVDAVLHPQSAAPILLRGAQARLSASEHQLRTILARCPVLVVEFERSGELRYCNAAVRALFGSGDAFRSFAELVETREEAHSAEALIEEFFTRGASERLLAMRGQGGTTHWIEWTTAPATNNDCVLMFGVDVSHRRQLMAEQVARSKAEAANQAKAEFLAMVSHELRTPLNAISGYAQLLESGIGGPLQPQQLGYLARIQRSQQHLLSMINDIIDFARLEAGKLTLHKKPVLVSGVVELCETLTRPQAADKKISLVFTNGHENLLALADEARIQQILVNLVTNAIKFTRPGGRIVVRTQDAGDDALITVSDTGAGIPPEQQEAIFQPFVQVETGPTRTRDGFGLGLAISRELARRMGGDLTLHSEVAVGSSFVLRLPKPNRH